jgi:hypothetical protein
LLDRACLSSAVAVVVMSVKQRFSMLVAGAIAVFLIITVVSAAFGILLFLAERI